MKTIVIAGGGGFLGSSLAAYLSGVGYRVVILSRSFSLRREGTLRSLRTPRVTWKLSLGMQKLQGPGAKRWKAPRLLSTW